MTKTYTGDIVPMISHTTLSFTFDSDGVHNFQKQIRMTETETSNLLGIDFCRKYVSKLHFELPAKVPKDTAKAICYGNFCTTKHCTFVSKLHTIENTPSDPY